MDNKRIIKLKYNDKALTFRTNIKNKEIFTFKTNYLPNNTTHDKL
ncbi:hypothetical protein [Listeria monocytogenes]|nr:hypothetical protein [Listeria monocytogenes]EXL26337.1 hypothetical protein X842_0101 [Listeria monocytogenes Lm_1880]CDK42694.1 hypothetical protein LMQOC1_30891 [Listeria monocytogenes QOC1]CUK49220.1 hypothetical protein LM57179_130117 [Listeria monocytogenes]CUK75414.1 hypothetical protein LM6186_100161 [Listeria monocytogenes]CUL49198.1 hypothetical protein LM77097_100117 [Listeria monocytogenes]